MSIVIIGGGLAGGTAATELRDCGYTGPITVVAAEGHLPYERPPLSKGYLLGKEPIDKAFVHDRDWYLAHDVDLRLATRVTEIDTAARTVTLVPAAGAGAGSTSETGAGETLPYDGLLIATGAQPRHLAMADAGPTRAVYLRTIEDSQALREAFTEGARVTIIGAGWIGLEVAAAAREAGCEVTVFETLPLPLLRVLGPEVAAAFADLHRAHGVDLRFEAAVTEEDLAAADIVIVGIGAVPDTALARAAGLEVDNGILVDAALRASAPDVYAIGDVANQDHPALGRRIRVEHWDTAIEQAKVAARNLAGGSEAYTRLPYFFTDQYDLGMEYFGSVGPEGYDRVDIEGDLDVANGGAFQAYWVSGGAVVAAMHANDWDASDTVRDSVGSKR